jgi:hypothetical protein
MANNVEKPLPAKVIKPFALPSSPTFLNTLPISQQPGQVGGSNYRNGRWNFRDGHRSGNGFGQPPYYWRWPTPP